MVLVIISFFVPLFGLLAFVAFRAYRGRNWARWVLAATGVVGTSTYIPTLLTTLRVEPFIGVLDLLVTIAEVASLGLLFVRESNQWYRNPTQQVGAT
jgi:hypothetical protein